MERQGKRWCEDEVNEALEYLEQGWTIDEIAEQLERSYTAVQAKITKMGLYKKYEKERYEVQMQRLSQILKEGKN